MRHVTCVSAVEAACPGQSAADDDVAMAGLTRYAHDVVAGPLPSAARHHPHDEAAGVVGHLLPLHLVLQRWGAQRRDCRITLRNHTSGSVVVGQHDGRIALRNHTSGMIAVLY